LKDVMRLFVSEPQFEGQEEAYLLDCLRNGRVSSGRFVREFEEEFAQYIGVDHAVACNSGTAALHLALLGLGLKKGDEVIAPTFTMAASINSIIMTGAKPVLVDADSETYCINVDKIEGEINNRTKGIMAVHIYGHPCDMDRINEIAKKYDLFVIEDAAEAHGAEYKGKKCGSMSDIGCFSFYANKILTTGEGGMCVTNNLELAEKMRRLRNHAFHLPRFIHKEVGFNYRLTNVQAAIGTAQIENVEMLVEARRNVGKRYNKKLEGFDKLILPVEKDYAKNVYWMYGVVLSDNVRITKEEVMQKLKEKGIDTRSFFIPMHRQPAYYNKTVENAPNCDGEFPIADKIGARGFYLPSSSNITDEEIETVDEILKEVLLE
ncbi:MAG: DegT/DnrJ/EryC1/StrS aminotransferase family protein, partial [Nanoarchaeota archaeon]